MVALFALAGFGIWKKEHTARIEAERAAAEAAAQRQADDARRRENRQLRYADPPAVPAAAPAAVPGAPPARAPAPAASATAVPAAATPAEKPAEDAAPEPLRRFRREAEAEFNSADANGDGYISADEARRFPMLAKNFKRVDTDGDGRISQREFFQAKRAMLERKFAK